MSETRAHAISVTYTKTVTEQSRVTTNVEQSPLELADRAVMSFYERQYPWEHEVPDTITVDGKTFTYEEVQEYAKNRRASR